MLSAGDSEADLRKPANIAIGERLRRALVVAEMTQEEAARIAKVTPKTFSRWVNGHVGVDVAAVFELAEHLGVDPGYLIAWDSSDPTLTLADVVQSSTAAAVNRIAGRGLRPTAGRGVDVPPTRSDDDEFISIPVHDVRISAGAGLAAIEQGHSDDQWQFPRRWLQERFTDLSGLRIAPVVGDSMEPELRDGDRLLFNVNKRSLTDGIHVVRVDDSLMVKRIQAQGATVRLLSTNPVYAPIAIDLAGEPDRFSIIGKAEWTGKMIG